MEGEVGEEGGKRGRRKEMGEERWKERDGRIGGRRG